LLAIINLRAVRALEHIRQLGKVDAVPGNVLNTLGFVPDEHADQRSWPRKGINSY